MAKSKEPLKIHIERMGKVQTWTLPLEPFKSNARKRAEFENGFRARTFDFNQGVMSFGWPDKSAAWVDGYHAAQEQEAKKVK